jgi:two-component system nitrogen regulation response regulator GlnG
LEDVPELAHYFLFRFSRDMHLDFRGFAPEVIERFQLYGWPGNVRELQGAVQQAMLNASGHLILPEFLPASLATPDRPILGDKPAEARAELEIFIDRILAENQDQLHEKTLAAVERVLFTKILQATHGNQAKASEMLGLNRATLRHRLRALKLAVDKIPIDIEAKDRDAPA